MTDPGIGKLSEAGHHIARDKGHLRAAKEQP